MDNLDQFGGGWVLYVKLPTRRADYSGEEALVFREEWNERLASLPRGQQIAALCKIAARAASHVPLEDCELIRTRGADNAAP